jgi:hypothetical protein
MLLLRCLPIAEQSDVHRRTEMERDIRRLDAGLGRSLLAADV